MDIIAPFIPLVVLFIIISLPFIIARKKTQQTVDAIVCPKCLSVTNGKFRLSFLGLKNIKCQSCGKKIKSPLTWGMRISYFILLLILIISMVNELNIFILLFIVLILIALSMDLKAVLSNKNANKSFQQNLKTANTSINHSRQ